MAQEQYPQNSISYEIALKMRDLEESQKLSKDRILLISENFIESQEKNINEITELKKQVQNINDDLKKIKSIIQNLSSEVAKSARKEEIAIIERQYKMFDPLKLVRMEDLEKMIDKKLHNHSPKEEKKKDFWSGKL